MIMRPCLIKRGEEDDTIPFVNDELTLELRKELRSIESYLSSKGLKLAQP